MLSTRPDDCAADAARLLAAEGLTCNRVVSVDGDSILYLNSIDRPRTAWLHRPARGRLRVTIEAGFVAMPPKYWHDERPGDRL